MRNGTDAPVSAHDKPPAAGRAVMDQMTSEGAGASSSAAAGVNPLKTIIIRSRRRPVIGARRSSRVQEHAANAGRDSSMRVR